jgi:hypothetical protein
MSKKIRVGDVWSVRHLNADSTFIVWIDEDEQLINIDECGRSWPLIDEYWHGLVKRLQKGDGEPFIPAALRESETSQNDSTEEFLPEVTAVTREVPKADFGAIFELGYYNFNGLLMWRGYAPDDWHYCENDFWKDADDGQDDYFFAKVAHLITKF